MQDKYIKIGSLEIPDFPLILAPMEDITDPPFRLICKEMGADIVYTEFVSSEGLIRDAGKSVQKLDIYPGERPVAIQIFGNSIESMVGAARSVEQAAPDFIDINFGCPVRKVAMKGAGAGLLNDVPKMVAMTEAVVKSVKLPVTVKTRLGWDQGQKNIVDIAERLQDVGISAIAIHGRTRCQLYGGQADWTLIGEVKNNPRMTIPVFGNGDIKDVLRAKEVRDTYGVDGVMIGRATIGNPWIFREIKHYLETGQIMAPPTLKEKAETCRRHIIESVKWKGDRAGVFEMRKHYSQYFKGIPHFKPYRMELVEAGSLDMVLEILDRIAMENDEALFAG